MSSTRSHRDPKGEGEPKPLPHDQETCLCCRHFAVDLENEPEALTLRPTRRPRRFEEVEAPALALIA